VTAPSAQSTDKAQSWSVNFCIKVF
jgi:hypothetical protein